MEVVASSVALAGAALAAGKVIVQLKSFASSIKDVDANISSFCSELETLQTVLGAIKESFTEIGPTVNQNDSIKQLFICIDKTVSDCQHTVGKLELIFRRLNKKSGGAYQAIVKQLKMNMGSDDIASLRRQVLSYNVTFQTSLSTITLCVILQNRNNQPNHDVAEALSPKLNELTEHLRRLEMHQKTDAANLKPEEDDEDGNQIAEDIEDTRQSAQAIFNSASTVVGQWSTTGSEFGVPLTSNKRRNVRAWIEEVSSTTSPTGADKSPFSMGSDASDFTTAILVDSQEPVEPVLAEHLEARTHLVKRGIAHYKRGKYSVSHKCFKQATDIGGVGDQPQQGVMGDDTLVIWLCLSTIRLASIETKTQRDTLLKDGERLLKLADTNAKKGYYKDGQHYLNTCLLAQANFYLERVDVAEEHCKTVMKIADQQNTKGGTIYNEAVLLMIEILYEKGQVETAAPWCLRVKPSMKDKARELFQETEFARIDNFPDLAQLLYAVKLRAFIPALELLCSNTYGPLGKESIEQWTPFQNQGQGSSDEIYWLIEVLETKSLALLSLFIENGAHLEHGPQLFEGRSRKPEKGSHLFQRHFQTPLIFAIESNNLAAARRLIEHGANVEARRATPAWYKIATTGQVPTHMYCTPLGYTVFNGFREMTELLLNNGAKVNCAGHDIEPPLSLALRSSAGRKLVPILLKAGANPNATVYRITPLCIVLCYIPQARPAGDPLALECPNAVGQTQSASKDFELEAVSLAESLIAAGANVRSFSSLPGNTSTCSLSLIDKDYCFKSVLKRLYVAGLEKPKWWKSK